MLELIERPGDIHLIFWRPLTPGIETPMGVQVDDHLVLRTSSESLGITIDEILPNNKYKVRIDSFEVTCESEYKGYKVGDTLKVSLDYLWPTPLEGYLNRK